MGQHRNKESCVLHLKRHVFNLICISRGIGKKEEKKEQIFLKASAIEKNPRHKGRWKKNVFLSRMLIRNLRF
jgi:hypothetical protein